MAWKDNALGITIDRTMNADFAALKAAGFSFVVLEGGTAWDLNPAFGEQYSKAMGAGLPVMVQYVPISAIDDYVFEAPAREQIAVLQKLLGTRKIHGLIISMERYWVGWDLEQGHNPIRTATNTSIAYTASEFMNTFTKQYAPLNVPVLLRTNDGFVQKYAQGISGWSDKFGFYLADWRYRTRAADGSYTLYTVFPRTTFTALTDYRAVLPPVESKNPLVPGNVPQLKFWEFTGTAAMPAALVKGWDNSPKAVKLALFNGNEAAVASYLGANPSAPQEPTPPHTVPEDPSVPETSGLEGALARIVALCEQMAVDLHTIRSIFRE